MQAVPSARSASDGHADSVQQTRYQDVLRDDTVLRPNDLVHHARRTVRLLAEAALAYGARLPLLLVVEDGLHRECMSSDRLEWHGIQMDIKVHALSSEE